MWFLFAFALFSFMGTKFHHYIFPAVPPAAMLVGVVLDDMLGKRRSSKPGSSRTYALGLGAGGRARDVGASRACAGSVFARHRASARRALGTAVIVWLRRLRDDRARRASRSVRRPTREADAHAIAPGKLAVRGGRRRSRAAETRAARTSS